MFTQLTNVRRLFAHNYFRPAKVQRQYVWGALQCETFHNDLVEAFRASNVADYYLGPIILAEDEKQDVVWVYDGQQRLTTLTIYLAALGQVCSGIPRERAAALARCERPEEVRPRIDLRTKGGALTKVIKRELRFRNIPQNMPVDWRIFEIEKTFLSRLKEMPDVDAFSRWVQDHVLLNVLWSRNDTGLLLFDRANNRGVRLEWYELAKSIVAAAAGPDFRAPKGKTFEEFWYETERGAKREFADLIGCAAFVRYGQMDPSLALSEFEEEFDTSADQATLDAAAQDLVANLGLYRETSSRLQELRDVRGPVESPADLIRLQLLFLEFPHWKALLMFAEAQGLRGESELGFLVRLRRFAFVAHLLGWPAQASMLTDVFRKALKRLRNGFMHGEGAATDLFDFSSMQLAQARGSLSGALMDATYYRPLVKLLESERAYRKGVLNASAIFLAHVEHILPRAPRGDWCSAFENEDERADLRNRLGNLCLLSKEVNMQLSNAEWSRKRTAFQAVNACFVGAGEIADHTAWMPSTVTDRTRAIVGELTLLLGI